MQSDRSVYDQGAYMIKTKESNKPLSYMLMINAHENCTVCGNIPNVSVHADRVNLENDIFGITRKLTKDPSKEYQMDPKIAQTLNYVPPYLCERNIMDPSFINQSNTNQYMNDLKKSSINAVELFASAPQSEKFINLNLVNNQSSGPKTLDEIKKIIEDNKKKANDAILNVLNKQAVDITNKVDISLV